MKILIEIKLVNIFERTPFRKWVKNTIRQYILRRFEVKELKIGEIE